LPDETVELICRLARENPRWGYLRIVGELKKLGVPVSKTSVASVLRRHGLRPAPRRQGPSWSEFLHAQAEVILATDFFSVDSMLQRRRSSTVSTVKKSQASIVVAWDRRNSAQVGPDRRGAGSIPCRRRTAHTLEGARSMPMVASSPWARR
jgi:hypothetical protein